MTDSNSTQKVCSTPFSKLYKTLNNNKSIQDNTKPHHKPYINYIILSTPTLLHAPVTMSVIQFCSCMVIKIEEFWVNPNGQRSFFETNLGGQNWGVCGRQSQERKGREDQNTLRGERVIGMLNKYWSKCAEGP